MMSEIVNSDIDKDSKPRPQRKKPARMQGQSLKDKEGKSKK